MANNVEDALEQKMNYKFLKSEHIDEVIQGGIIKISSLSYFRERERDNNPWIGDRLEGVFELRIEDACVITESSPELSLINNVNCPNHFKIQNGGRVIYKGGQKITYLSRIFYLLCKFWKSRST